jgi:ABC-type multidrug transport system fused ATPase/permease subunit
MDIGSNERIAFVGPSGGGKSTLLSLVMGFMKGYGGSIKINGMELNEIEPEAWRKCYAYVPQHTRIFKASIMENLLMSKPSANLEEVYRTAQITGVDTFVDLFPEKYDTVVGEGGMALSGGQMQLIAIARAYLKGTGLIILDEPTSALDPETERLINSSIDLISKDRTVIIIAHRIPTVVKSDRIYVIEDGSVREYGEHHELITKMGVYHRLLMAWGVKL